MTSTTRDAVLVPREQNAHGRSVRISPDIWDQVALRCRDEEDRPASYAWGLLGAAYARGLIDLPVELSGVGTERPQSKSLRLLDWVWEGVNARYERERESHWHNPWALLGAAYARGDLDLPRTALIYPA